MKARESLRDSKIESNQDSRESSGKSTQDSSDSPPKPTFLTRLRGIWAALSTLIILPFIILGIYICRTKNSHARAMRKTSRIFFYINGFKMRLIGDFDKSAQLLILNHQSIMDIGFMEAFYPWDVCWVAKKELGEVPLYGHALKAPRMILIDREDKKSLIFLLREARKKLDDGRILAIFPEGTRSKGGARFLPFKSGAKMLIEKYTLKIQPIVLINTRNLFDAATLEVREKCARAVVLEAFTPDFKNPKWYENLEAKMQEIYTQHFEEMRGLRDLGRDSALDSALDSRDSRCDSARESLQTHDSRQDSASKTRDSRQIQ